MVVESASATSTNTSSDVLAGGMHSAFEPDGTGKGGGATLVNLRHRASANGEAGPQASVAQAEEGEVALEIVRAIETDRFNAPNDGTPQRGAQRINRDDWLPMLGENKWSYARRLLTEGHTVPDAFMTCACAQVGQIVLNSPNALFKMGLVAGGISMFVFLLSGSWTIYQFMALYLELKKRRMQDGSWWETDGKHVRVLQMFEVYDFYLGSWGKISSVIVLVVALIGLLMTQINACANNMYYVDQSKPKRTWGLIFGGIMAFTMILFPRFSNFRLINIIGLVTVGCMSVFIIVTSAQYGMRPALIKMWPDSSQDYFTGAAVWLTILGTHSVTFETLESMEQPRHFKTSFIAAWCWTILITVPSSFVFNFAYPEYQVFLQVNNQLPYADNVFSLLGDTASGLPGTPGAQPTKLGIYAQLLHPPTASQSKYAMAILMNIHQFIAFALYGTSLCFIWEKLWRVHQHPYWIRILVRIPVGGFIWFLAILCPFYGAINALLASLAIPYLGFVLPAICHLWFFRSRKQLSDSQLSPYGFISWSPESLALRLEAIHPRLGLVVTPWFWINLTLMLVYAGFGGTAIYYSILGIKQSFQTFGAFAVCYACLS